MKQMRSGYFPNLTHERIMEEIELSERVAQDLEWKELGQGPLLDLMLNEDFYRNRVRTEEEE